MGHPAKRYGFQLLEGQANLSRITTTRAEQGLLIGELAQRAGVGAKAIRYYEQIGLLPRPARSAAGYRVYERSDVERVRFIRGVQRLGFSLGEISEILALRDRGQAPCRYVTERLEHRANEVARQIMELKRLKGELAALRHRARQLPANRPAEHGYCHILEQHRATPMRAPARPG